MSGPVHTAKHARSTRSIRRAHAEHTRITLMEGVYSARRRRRRRRRRPPPPASSCFAIAVGLVAVPVGPHTSHARAACQTPHANPQGALTHLHTHVHIQPHPDTHTPRRRPAAAAAAPPPAPPRLCRPMPRRRPCARRRRTGSSTGARCRRTPHPWPTPPSRRRRRRRHCRRCRRCGHACLLRL